MANDMSLPREAALLIRPLPAALTTGAEPIRFGGCPRLPEDFDWPCREDGYADHFFAEIDLAKLAAAAGSHPVPAFPTHGTLFVFLPLALDGIFDRQKALVLHTDQDVSKTPERTPPETLPNLHADEHGLIHADGTTHGGRALVRQVAEALPFQSARAVNPLAVNMADAGGADVNAWREAHRLHQAALLKTYASARAMPPDPTIPPRAERPDGSRAVKDRVPDGFTKYRFEFEGHHLDWEFIFDWAQEFYRQCFSITIDHLRDMIDDGNSQWLVPRFIKRFKRKRAAHNKRRYGQGRKPWFWTFDDPVPRHETFDWQARRWLSLSQFATGHPPDRFLTAFCDMQEEILRHANEVDQDDYRLGPRIGMLDSLVRGHDKHSGYTKVAAQDAFKHASKRAAQRYAAKSAELPQATRWDSRVVRAATPSAETGFSLGIMPLQMFGLGFEIQSAVSEHAEDVLLLQIGDSFGLPLQIGPDMILQLWITPEDLAAGRFDQVEMTLDMT